jgi:hypothetical protein
MQKKWWYQIITDVLDDSANSKLTEAGKKGWELVGFAPPRGDGAKALNHYTYIFKRPYEQNEY